MKGQAKIQIKIVELFILLLKHQGGVLAVVLYTTRRGTVEVVIDGDHSHGITDIHRYHEYSLLHQTEVKTGNESAGKLTTP